LSFIQGSVPLGIVADQDFAECGIEGLDVFGELLTVLEVELVLATLFGGARGQVAVLRCIGQDGGTKLFVYKDARLFLRHAGRNSLLEDVVDHLLGGSDFRRLFGSEWPLPTEHFRLE
jgi:hypothetical protein